MNAAIKCPKCGELMDAGFTAARSDSSATLNYWFDGKPEKGFFGAMRTSGKKQIPVQTFRCPACGYLETYALDTGA